MSQTASLSTPVERVGYYRWFICALLFFALSILYVDRQILSLLKPMLDDQMKWTDQEFGWINSAFQGAYGLSMLGFGWFIDRFGTKLGYVACVVAWSISAFATSFVGSVRGFVFARFAVGASEGGCFPTSIKTAALWFPKSERALATSIFNSGTNVGAIIGPAIIPWIGLTWGWQGAYIAVSAAGVVWVIAWSLLYNTPENAKHLSAAELAYIHSDPDEAQQDSTGKVRWASLLRYRQAWAFIAAKFMTDPIWWFFLTWLPDFFKKTRGLDIKHSWTHLVTIYAIVTVLSIVGGWVTGHLAKRGWSVSRARKTGMFVFALCVVPILAVTHVGDWTAVLLIGLAGASHQAWSANLFTSVSDMFPKLAVASVIGIGGMMGSFGSMLFQPFTGFLLDHFKTKGDVTEGYTILFGICGCAYLVAFGVNHLLAPKFEQVKLEGTTPEVG